MRLPIGYQYELLLLVTPFNHNAYVTDDRQTTDARNTVSVTVCTVG